MKRFWFRLVQLSFLFLLVSCDGVYTGSPSHDYYGGGAWYYPPPNYAYVNGDWVALPPAYNRPGQKPGNNPGNNPDRPARPGLKPEHPIADGSKHYRPAQRPSYKASGSRSRAAPSIPSRSRGSYGGGRRGGGGRR